MFRILLAFTSAILFFSSCATTTMSVRVAYPPHISLPQNVKNIALINRSRIDSLHKKENALESILTGEAIAGDMTGSEECLNAFAQAMNEWDSPHAFIPVQHIVKRNALNVQLPDPLTWATVKNICRKNQCDAIMVLETFDTNSDNVVGTVLSGVSIVKSGGYIPAKEIHYSITYSWRLYDTLSMSVPDQFSDQLHQTVGGLFPTDPIPTSAIRSAGNEIGDASAQRYLPVFVWQDRDIYKKGNDLMEIAWRKAVANDWKGAMEKWNALSTSSDSKIAGRTCFNMALGCEVLGKIDLAKTWAQKSFTDYGNNKARDYLYVLNHLPNY